MMTRFKPYPGFDPMDGDEPGMALSRDNPVRPMTEEEVERAHDKAASEDESGG